MSDYAPRTGPFLICFALMLVPVFFQTDPCHARSAFSSRHSGLEAPGEGRGADGMSALGMRAGRTAEGGMGYSDAYGNTLDDQPAEEKKPRKRVHPGAYGHNVTRREVRGLPDPDRHSGVPAWSYR